MRNAMKLLLNIKQNLSSYRDFAFISERSSMELTSYFKPYLLGVNNAFTGLATQTKITRP